MTQIKRKIITTTALFYANGPLHLGHMLETIQADIFTRFQRMNGNTCFYICGSDAHGTPIMIKAEKMGIQPEELIAIFKKQHEDDFAKFYISFDNYYTTHSEENQELSNYFYEKLKERGDIKTRIIAQAYDPVKEMFLPDRYVKGECPRCGTSDQYGDSCEACGATYSPTELKNPISVLSGATPIQKNSEHYFFELPNYKEFLQQWMREGHVQSEVVNKLNEWFEQGLQAWDISRDTPYFGFKIPSTENKYFYVWLDAPIGYIASFKNFCSRHSEINFDEFWNKDSKTELHHFIGKDIIYFHALFWPAMLKGAELRTPTAVHAHGFLTIDGQKMSKSRGTFIKASTFAKHLNPEYLRYYFSAKLTSHIDDIDLSFSDFTQRINSDLVGKVINIASRCAGFISKNFNNTLSEKCDDLTLYKKFLERGITIADHFNNRETAKATRDIMELADLANQYIDEKKPWSLIKQSDTQHQAHEVASLGINLFRVLMIYLKPILPKLAEEVEDFLNIPAMQWDSGEKPLVNHAIKVFKPLMQRIDAEAVQALKEAAKEDAGQ